MHILDTASTAGDAAIAGLLEEPNQADALLPGTNLRLVRELPGTTMLQANRKYRGLIGEMCEVRTLVSSSKALPPGQNRCMSRAAPLIFLEDGFRPGHA